MSQRDGDVRGRWFDLERSGKHIFTQTLLVGLAVFCWCGMGVAGEPVPHGGKSAGSFMNYVLPTNGFDTEMVIVNNDVMNHRVDYAVMYRAYDQDGVLLAEKPDNVPFASRVRFSLAQLFPGVNVDDIALVEVTGSNKNDAWVIYSHGDQKAMVPAPVDGSSVVDNLHFTDNTGYWDFILNLARVTADESTVRAVVYPSGEEWPLDGTANPYGFVMPNLGLGVSAASMNMAHVFGGVVPDDAAWMQVYSENIQETPLGNTVTPGE